MPTIRPLVASILLAFTAGPTTALWTAVAHVVISHLQANVVFPIVQKKPPPFPQRSTFWPGSRSACCWGQWDTLLATPILVVLFVIEVRLKAPDALVKDAQVPTLDLGAGFAFLCQRRSRPMIADTPSMSERQTVLDQLEEWIEIPMLVLGFLWLGLVVVELVWGDIRLLETFGTGIWIVFIAEFALRLWLAPHKTRFLTQNIISLIALIVPAFRILRIFRAVRLLRGLRLIRVVGAANRGMRALKASMARRGLGYMLLLSLLVLVLGSAGMYALEPAGADDRGFESYGDALWWTSMLMASLGTDYWPHSPEGRVLCFLIALFGLGVFGYITASFASFFVGRDAARANEIAGASDVAALHEELVALRLSLERITRA
jgi:voltage-gated potassium channel